MMMCQTRTVWSQLPVTAIARPSGKTSAGPRLRRWGGAVTGSYQPFVKTQLGRREPL